MGRFSGAELEELGIDPREPVARTPCPFCPGEIFVGVRNDSRNICLFHTAHLDPTDATRTRFVSACEQYSRVRVHDDVFKRLHAAGARFERMTPS